MQREEIAQLVQRYLNDTATAEELERLNDWYHSASEDNQVWFAEVRNEEALLRVAMYSRIAKQLGIEEVPGNRGTRLWPWMGVAAAAALATIVFGLWFFTGDREILKQVQDDVVWNDIAPGKSGATITLSTGEVIQLSEAKKGVIVDPTSLTYDDGSKGTDFSLKTETTVQMTASTAKGQTYEFSLSDGTHVFLNSDSKIKFPAQFSGKERRIFLQGEAYFVVKHNEQQPFRVESKGADGKSQVVEDIGTEFNINAYADESSIKTTLVEGEAAVYAGAGPKSSAVSLKPKQQASFANARIAIKAIDPEEAIAWKNGDFIFRDESLENIMQQVARWYDVEVVYSEEKLKSIKLGGFVSRDKPISAVLRMMSLTKRVKFEVKGKQIKVLSSL
ncbi:FecR family protein [Pedobacter sp. GR22-6]|uniref:FecR family protein n=1 Tax=Pedobacter sp. GR22-6 TaxID=3127957 RepID=UPI00307FA418